MLQAAESANLEMPLIELNGRDLDAAPIDR